MNCEHYQTLFFDQERQLLPPQVQQELELHLQNCPHCAAMLSSLRQVNDLLDRQRAPSPEAEMRFRERLHLEARVGAQRQATARSWPLASRLQQWWRRVWPAQPLGAFAYSVALLMLGLVGGQYLPPRSFGFGAEANLLGEQNLSRERLIQLCAVPPQPATNLF